MNYDYKDLSKRMAECKSHMHIVKDSPDYEALQFALSLVAKLTGDSVTDEWLYKIEHRLEKKYSPDFPDRVTIFKARVAQLFKEIDKE